MNHLPLQCRIMRQTLSNLTTLLHRIKTVVPNWFRRRSFPGLNSSIIIIGSAHEWSGVWTGPKVCICIVTRGSTRQHLKSKIFKWRRSKVVKKLHGAGSVDLESVTDNDPAGFRNELENNIPLWWKYLSWQRRAIETSIFQPFYRGNWTLKFSWNIKIDFSSHDVPPLINCNYGSRHW